MRKSLNTECKLLSVALVSRISVSNCFSISWVFDSILWEKSLRNSKSCEEKKWLWRQHQLQRYTFHNPLKYSDIWSSFLTGKRWWRITVFLAYFRAWEAVFDLPLSHLPRTSWHCSAASLQQSRVAPKSELSVHSCLGHLLLPPATRSSSIRSFFY